MSKLTKKQQKFADEYIISLNATAAYKIAYPSVQKDSAARANGSRLLTNANVSAYIEERMEEIQSDKVADQQEIMERLTRIGRREEMEYQVVTLRTKEDRWVTLRTKEDRWVNVGTEEKPVLKKQSVDTEEEKIVPIPAKLSDANKALELLGKRYAMWTDKKEVDVTAQVVFMGEDELED